MKKHKVFIDMDGVLANYKEAFEDAIHYNDEMPFPQSQVGFFLNLVDIAGAIHSAKRLIKAPHLDVYILTAPSYKNPACYTEKRMWIEKHFGLLFCQKIIICNDKSMIKMTKDDYLIDDYASGRGQDKIDGNLILFQGGNKSVHEWTDIVYDLLELENE
jgi:5'-nucleotidase